jgi:Protein of unknown function (DUF742)
VCARSAGCQRGDAQRERAHPDRGRQGRPGRPGNQGIDGVQRAEDIAALCHDILSIAEVSARLHLPLGVIRVLVGDMADEHLVMVRRPAQAGDRPDLALLERVLYGLHTS